MTEKAFLFELRGSGDEFYCYIKVVGKLTHEDYEKFVPMFEKTLSNIKEPKVKVLVDITELDGWELQALWDDLKFGLTHNNEFTNIAVVGKNHLYEYGVKISNWFTHAKMQYFENINEASNWLEIEAQK